MESCQFKATLQLDTLRTPCTLDNALTSRAVWLLLKGWRLHDGSHSQDVSYAEVHHYLSSDAGNSRHKLVGFNSTDINIQHSRVACLDAAGNRARSEQVDHGSRVSASDQTSPASDDLIRSGAWSAVRLICDDLCEPPAHGQYC